MAETQGKPDLALPSSKNHTPANPPVNSTRTQATVEREEAIVQEAVWHDLRTWTVSNMITATLLAVLVGFGFLLLYQFYMVVLIFFIALSLSIAIKPATIYLERYHIPPRVSIILIYLLLTLFIGLFIWIIVPLVLAQVSDFVSQMPTYYGTLRDYFVNSRSVIMQTLGTFFPTHFFLVEQQVMEQGDATGSLLMIWNWVSSTANGLLILIVVLLLAYYWTLEGESLLQRLLWRIPQNRRKDIRTFVDEVQVRIGGYVRGQTLLCFIIGVSSAVAFWIIGVPNAFTLGLIMGIFEALPVIGPILGAVPSLLLTVSTAPEKTLWVIIALATIQQLENSLLVPRIMDESVGVNAIVSILAISAFGLLFGILGAILAIPLAAILQILLNRILFQDPPELAAEPALSIQESRDRFSVLRLEAQTLAQDVRKQARSESNVDDSTRLEEEATDTIELLASELDTLLLGLEGTA